MIASNVQDRPTGATSIGASPTGHGIARLFHVPSSQRICFPAWHLAAPAANEMPPNWHVFETTTEPSGVQLRPNACHSPPSQRYSEPFRQATSLEEYIVAL